jgi:hypothetical protein
LADLVAGEDHGQALGAAGADGVEGLEVEAQDVAIEEEQGGQGLVLGAGPDVALGGQVGEEGFDLGGAEGGRMAEGGADLAEADVLFDPAEVALFGALGEAFDAGDLAGLVEELHGRFLRHGQGEAGAHAGRRNGRDACVPGERGRTGSRVERSR